VPSGLLYEGLFYFLRANNGVLSCVDAISGEVQYEGQKLGGVRSVYASPVAAAGRIYITSRDGLTKVIRMGPEYGELASNQLDDAIDATPAIVGNEIFMRGQEFLYCIAEN
jgi:outer membrane protein assembly factor BamB